MNLGSAHGRDRLYPLGGAKSRLHSLTGIANRLPPRLGKRDRSRLLANVGAADRERILALPIVWCRSGEVPDRPFTARVEEGLRKIQLDGNSVRADSTPDSPAGLVVRDSGGRVMIASRVTTTQSAKGDTREWSEVICEAIRLHSLSLASTHVRVCVMRYRSSFLVCLVWLLSRNSHS
jgi:hypothetical protein